MALPLPPLILFSFLRLGIRIPWLATRKMLCVCVDFGMVAETPPRWCQPLITALRPISKLHSRHNFNWINTNYEWKRYICGGGVQSPFHDPFFCNISALPHAKNNEPTQTHTHPKEEKKKAAATNSPIRSKNKKSLFRFVSVRCLSVWNWNRQHIGGTQTNYNNVVLNGRAKNATWERVKGGAMASVCVPKHCSLARPAYSTTIYILSPRTNCIIEIGTIQFNDPLINISGALYSTWCCAPTAKRPSMGNNLWRLCCSPFVWCEQYLAIL